MNVQAQLRLELSMINAGIERFYNAQDRLQGHERASAMRATNNSFEAVREAVQAQVEAYNGRSTDYQKQMKEISIDLMAIAVIKMAFQHAHTTPTFTSLAGKIGRAIAFELSSEFNSVTEVGIGTELLGALLSSCSFFETVMEFEGVNRIRMFQFTEEGMAWMEEDEGRMSLMHPVQGPMIAPPRAWKNVFNGGYYTKELVNANPLVKVKDGQHRRAINSHNGWADVMAHANKVQSHSYRINKDMVEIVAQYVEETLSEPVGHHRSKKEASRKSKHMDARRALSMALQYEVYDNLWFTLSADFRGRWYYNSSALNPQGNDIHKALLTSSEAKELGELGGYYFMIEGANRFGVDKVSFADRVQWVRDNHDSILDTDMWKQADSPLFFKAWVIEYKKWSESNFSTEFKTNITCFFDGTCNGLQHYSAILRDEIGGSAVNLINHNKPSDIYGIVAEGVKAYLIANPTTEGAEWLKVGVNRKLTKRPVMTLVYGATSSSRREYIQDYLDEVGGEADASFMTKVMTTVIENTLVAASTGMDWLRKQAQELGKRDEFPTWTTPSGFLVCQRTVETKTQLIQTRALGDVRAKVSLQVATGKVNKREQANSIAPNFVHSLDAAHMVLTSLAFGDEFMWLIHDSFGCHPADAAKLNRSIRETFVNMYETCPLCSFAEQNSLSINKLPQQGSLELNDVLGSSYFFG